MAVVIDNIKKGSIAFSLGIKPKEVLVSVNGREINDILDYLFYTVNESVVLEVGKNKRNTSLYNISKEEHEDIGLVFNDFLMDKQRSCHNRCIFCFIDQLPSGMRESIYVKDDDERLSFLFGNYLTLTNLDDKYINRIIEMNISPLNVSIHSTNPDVLRLMLGNRKAPDSIKKVQRLAKAGIHLNCQIVLCKGVNDKEELDRTLKDLTSLYPSVQSISVVPVGLTGHRKGLYELKDFSIDDAKETLDIISKWHNYSKKHYEIGLVYAADEWFLKVKEDIPDISYYDEMLQKENGVGMLAQFKEEFFTALEDLDEISSLGIDLVTGEMAFPFMQELMRIAKDRFPSLNYRVHRVKNEFFGGNVAVAGLLVGKDIMKQIPKEDIIGEKILIPSSILRSEGDLTLDDISLEQLSSFFSKEVIAIADGYDLVDTFRIGVEN